MNMAAEGLVLGDGRVVERGGMLRRLPGKREVFEGWLDGRHVLVKQYLDRERGAVHAGREEKGLRALAAAGVAAPEILFSGRDEPGNPVIVLAFIEEARPYSAVWREAESKDREQLARRMMRLLARHHAAGLRQTDLHLDNFLVTQAEIYSLDGAGIKVSARALKEGPSLENLALFCAQLPPAFDAHSIAIAEAYVRARDWDTTSVLRKLPALIDAARSWRWRKVSEKIFRDCTAIRHIKTAASEAFVVRRYADALTGVLSELDATCPTDAESLLKNGNTATVWGIKAGGIEMVVKRYNIKNWRHGFTRLVRESRASISWRNAHRLMLLGVKTPKPIACVTARSGGFGRVAYFLAERIVGPDIAEWVAARRSDAEALANVAGEVAEIFVQLRRWRIAHGDMKATNFIVTNNGVYLIDLDAMRQYRSQSAFERAWRGDMDRFAANWSDFPEFTRLVLDRL
ncbi:lipopolysaccharide kinase InaA family protein [Thiosocius teredinicola]|uniref:lipopolysaccharide kinase InaA family protein n=1 Tax=Thiosocius teredinicola TaxID=1973002 RepID=UPI000990C322